MVEKRREVHVNRVALYVVLTLMLSFSAIHPTDFPQVSGAQTQPTMYVDPPVTVASINATVSIYITVENVSDLCSWQTYIYYLNDIVEAKSYQEGPFLKSHGPTLFDGSFNNNFNSTHGELWMYGLRTWSGVGVNGSGVLGIVTFTAKSGGTSPLSLSDTILANSTAQQIAHITQNGQISVGGHDIAVVSILPLKRIVGQGFRIRINGTVANLGNYTETFNMTIYSNGTGIQTLSSSVTSGASKTLTFAWNTAGFTKGNYSISGTVPPVLYEVNIADNSLVDGWVFVSIPGDVNGDKVVDIFDAIILSSVFSSNPTKSNWNPNADINDDDIIDIFDAIILAGHFGESML
jgi:hypothetical protein